MNTNHLVRLNLTFRNTEATDAIRSYTEEKVGNCLRKFIHHDTEAQLVLRVEKVRHIAEITFHTDGHDFSVSQESQDMYASIDALVDALQQQLRKHKEKSQKHH